MKGWLSDNKRKHGQPFMIADSESSTGRDRGSRRQETRASYTLSSIVERISAVKTAMAFGRVGWIYWIPKRCMHGGMIGPGVAMWDL